MESAGLTEVRRALGRARRSCLHALGGVPKEAAISGRGPSLAEILPLLYPDGPDDPSLLVQARSIVGADRLATSNDLRKLLAALDRQSHPSPVSVRFRPADLTLVDLATFRIFIDGADTAVSATIAKDHTYEPHISAVVSRLCKPGMTALDVGANIGYYTLLFSRLVGPQGRVLAAEPNSENLRMILASLKENGVQNVELFPLALDARGGWAHFTNHLGSNGGLVREDSAGFVEGGGWIVPTTTLDELVDTTVDLIKVDVEGAEGRFLDGAQQTIRRCRPIIITEFSCEMLRRVSAVDPLDYLNFFAHLGYEMQIIDRANPGVLPPPLTPKELLADWADELRIEDLLLVPA